MKTIFSIAAVVLIAGCATPSAAPNWEHSFGTSTKQLTKAQVINPHASKDTTLGMTDGKAAAGAQTQYSTSYGYAVKEAKQPVVIVPTGK